MDENMELIQSIYQDTEMAKFSLEETLKYLKDKDNKIKVAVEEILKEYEKYYKCTSEILKQHEIKPDKKKMAKMGATMGIKKEIEKDNSDTAIADMLIQGIAMGSIDAEKKLKLYEDKAKKEYLKLTKEFLIYQEKAIDQLKKHL